MCSISTFLSITRVLRQFRVRVSPNRVEQSNSVPLALGRAGRHVATAGSFPRPSRIKFVDYSLRSSSRVKFLSVPRLYRPGGVRFCANKFGENADAGLISTRRESSVFCAGDLHIVSRRRASGKGKKTRRVGNIRLFLRGRRATVASVAID